MLDAHNILLARDFSPCAEAALPLAVTLAARTGARLHLFFAEVLREDTFNPPAHPTGAGERLRERLKEALEPDAPAGYDPGSLAVTHAVVRGTAAAPALLDYARQHEIDVIVMGTHGRRGMRRFMLGSVAEAVVRHAPCPVLTVPLPRDGRREADLSTLLVPVDFSTHSREALRHAKALAYLLAARLDLLHVMEPRTYPALDRAATAVEDDFDPESEDRALERLKRFYRHTEGPGTEVAFAVREGHPAGSILRYAEQEGSGLIVMGTHGLTGLERAVIGSVAENVVQQAPCPVLTLKSFGKSLVRPLAAGTPSAATAT